MTLSIHPVDGMIAVLSDAIASKRDTIALLERTAKDAQADLQHLRQERAVRLARAAGFEVGQVWVTNIYPRGARPAIVSDVRPVRGTAEESSDWLLEILFERDDHRPSTVEQVGSWQAQQSCIGRVDSGPILEKFAGLLTAAREQKGKAAA